jgi:hypothetical protein
MPSKRPPASAWKFRVPVGGRLVSPKNKIEMRPPVTPTQQRKMHGTEASGKCSAALPVWRPFRRLAQPFTVRSQRLRMASPRV